MTGNRIHLRSTTVPGPRRQVRWLSALIVIGATSLVASCASKGAGSTSGDASTIRTAAATATVTETVQSLAVEPDSGDNSGDDNSGGGDSGGTIKVSAPTLGTHYSGVGNWGPQDEELTDIHITIDPEVDVANNQFGVYSMDGEDGLTYGETSLAPENGYFRMVAECSAGQPIATESASVEKHDDLRCNQLTFDPRLESDATDPFHAVLTVNFQMTCTGQDNATCRQSPAGSAATTAQPVVLQFSKSINLVGSVSEAPSAVTDGNSGNSDGDSSANSEPPESIQGSTLVESAEATPDGNG